MSCSREGVEVFSLLPYGAIEKGQDPLEVPVRRGEQDLSLLQIATLQCQPPANFISKWSLDKAQVGGAG